MDFITAYGLARPVTAQSPRLGEERIRALSDTPPNWIEIARTIEQIIRVLGRRRDIRYDLMTVYDALHLLARCQVDPDSIHPTQHFQYLVWDRWLASRRER